MSHYSVAKDDTSIVAFSKSWEKHMDNFELLMYDVGREQCIAGHDWGPGKRGCHVIHRILTGKGKFIINSKQYDIKAGDIFYFAPNDLVYYRSDDAEPMDYIWVSFHGSKSSIIMKSTIIPEMHVVRDTGDALIEKSIKTIFDAVSSGSNVYSVLGMLYTFFGNLIDAFKKENYSSDDSISLSYVNNAIEFIENNYSTECTVNIISNHLGLTRSYLYKLFIQYVGVSPSAYLENFRIQKACELLLTGTSSIEESANAVGYQDRAYFSKVFKKINGVYPKEFILQNSKIVNI